MVPAGTVSCCGRTVEELGGSDVDRVVGGAEVLVSVAVWDILC